MSKENAVLKYYVEQKTETNGPGKKKIIIGERGKEVDKDYIEKAIRDFLTQSPAHDIEKCDNLILRIWETIDGCKKTFMIGDQIFYAKKN